MNQPEPNRASPEPGETPQTDTPQTDTPQPKTPPAEAAEAPSVQNLAPEQMARFVTTIKNADQQVGEHVIRALKHADTVAVVTTVVTGPGGQQHIVSAALDAQKTTQVNALLQGATEQREVEELCVGFHCLINPKETPEK